MEYMDIIWLILLLLVAVTTGIVIADTNRFVKREYSLFTDKTRRDYKICMLSDLHGKSFGKDNERLIRAIDEEKPDYIMIAGDMLTAKPEQDFSTAVHLVKELAKRYRIYYGSGNHEYRMSVYPEKYGDMSERFEKAIEDPEIIRLHNEKAEIAEGGIVVYGLEIGREYYRKMHAPKMDGKYVEQCIGSCDEKKYNILLAHNPDYLDAYASFGADLVLSGHVHGGIANLPFLGGVISPKLRLFPHFDGGRFEKERTTMILGRGLGTHTIPVRFLNPGELVILHLKTIKNKKVNM